MLQWYIDYTKLLKFSLPFCFRGVGRGMGVCVCGGTGVISWKKIIKQSSTCKTTPLSWYASHRRARDRSPFLFGNHVMLQKHLVNYPISNRFFFLWFPHNLYLSSQQLIGTFIPWIKKHFLFAVYPSTLSPASEVVTTAYLGLSIALIVIVAVILALWLKKKLSWRSTTQVCLIKLVLLHQYIIQYIAEIRWSLLKVI